MLGKYAFPKERRLRRRSEFGLAARRGVRVHAPHFLVFVRPNGSSAHRLGLAVNRKVGNAVRRNRVKRLAREFFRHAAGEWAGACDFLLAAKPGAAGLSGEETLEELRRLFEKALARAGGAGC